MTYHFSYSFEISYEDTLSVTHKQKKQKATMKERHQIIDFSPLQVRQEDLNDDSIEIGECATILISDKEGIQLVDHDTGEIQTIDVPIDIFYERSNGKEKILNQIIASHIDPDKALLMHDIVIAVDTNTINDTSVTAIAQMCFTGKTDGVVDVNCKVWDNTKILKPEVHAWAVVINTVYSQLQNKKQNKTVAIVVDSELGALQQYNKREKPLVQDIYLPPGFTLVYASADTGMEFIANQLIRICDKCASEVLKNR